MPRRLVFASAIAVVAAAAFLPGSGLGAPTAAAPRGGQALPAGLAVAIHARLGAAARDYVEPPLLGNSVALSADGTTALVGAPGAAHSDGLAYIFRVSDTGSWSSSATPTAVLSAKLGAEPQQQFGWDVALSADGTTAFVGAPFAGNGVSVRGAIFAFHVSAEDAWASTSTPTAALTTGSGDVEFANFVPSADGTTLVATYFDSQTQTGGASVFHVASEGAWATTSTPTADLTDANGGAGGFVAMSEDGTTALLDCDEGGVAGACVYHASAEDAWASSATPAAMLSDANVNGGVSGSLALSGDGTVAAIGDGYGTANGLVDVFHASGEAAWSTTSTPTATLTLADGVEGDTFGYTVAVSTDGTTAVVTAPYRANEHGVASIFHVADEGAWASSSAPSATLTNSSGHYLDAMGEGGAVLSADGATAFVGAPSARNGYGEVDVFHVSAASSWASSATPNAILVVAGCVVPKLTGRTLRAAKSALKAKSCALGRVTKVVVRHAKVKRGRVVSQSRKPGSRLPAGTKVAVKIRK